MKGKLITLQELEERIATTRKNIKNLERKKDIEKSKINSRKERASHLIKKGALLEIAGIDNVDSDILLGYFLWFKDVPAEKIEKLRARGKAEFERRSNKK